MAKKQADSQKNEVNVRKLKTNYELRYDFNKMLSEYIKSLPKEHRSTRKDSIMNADGVEKADWVRTVREYAMGNVVNFMVDNGIPFTFQNVPEDDINKLRKEYSDRQKRLAEILKLKAESLDISEEDYSFLKRKPYNYQKQAVKFFEINDGKAILGDQPGVGKMAPLYTLISTPNGWVKMGDIKTGDVIHDRFGGTSNVIGVYPQGYQDSYRVNFSDDSYTECGLEHLWSVRDHNRRKRNTGWTTKSLKELIELGITDKMSPSRLESNRKPSLKWEIPITEPVFYGEKNFLIHPYVLGALIGDGCMCTKSRAVISIPNFQTKISDKIKSHLPDDYRLSKYESKESCDRYAIVKSLENKTLKNTFVSEIISLNLNVKSEDKFIPNSYKKSSINQRFELLRGLMDTDGSAYKNRANYHTTSLQLAKDVVELVQSLGGIAKINIYTREKENKPTEYRVNIKSSYEIFHLDEKKESYKPIRNNNIQRHIKSVEFVGNVEQQCIMVDSKDHTYLTDNYIVTHNTLSAISYAVKHQYKTLVICPSSLKLNWRKEIDDFTNEKAFVYKYMPKKRSKDVAYKKDESLFHVINYESLDSYVKIEYKHKCKGKMIRTAGNGMVECGCEIINLNKAQVECPQCKNKKTFRSAFHSLQYFEDGFGEHLNPEDYDLIVIDESHRIKEKKTGWTQIIVRAFRDTIPRKILISGTAIKSRPSEFFTSLNFLNKDEWNNQHEFGVKYCAGYDTGFGWDYSGVSNLEQLFTRISGVFLRRLKKDVLQDLPPKTYTNMPIELTDAEYKEYEQILKSFKKEDENGKSVEESYLAKIAKLKLFTGRCKLKRAIDYIQDIIDGGEKVVIMSDLQELAEEVHKLFPKISVLHTGSMNENDKFESYQNFQKNKDIKVFSGMIMASGVGISLTEASRLIFLGFGWTPGDMMQAEDRIHRASTTHDNIQIITLYCVGTIDEDIMEFLDEKDQVVTMVLDNKRVDKKVHTGDYNMLKALIEKIKGQ